MALSSERILFAVSAAYQKIKGGAPQVRPMSILLLKYDEIGDVMCALPAIENILTTYADAKIDVVCKPYCAPIFENIKGINAVYTKFPKGNYNWVIDLRSNWSLFVRSVLLNPSFYAGRGKVRLANRGKQLHEIDTNHAILAQLNLQTGRQLWNFENAQLPTLPATPYAVVHAGARKWLRQWPIANFRALSQYLHTHYGLHSIYIGAGQQELEQITELTDSISDIAHNWVNKLDLNQTAKLIKQANIYLGNESGPLQIADFVGTKSLSFFGPGVSRVFYPRHAGSIVLHHILECNPCQQITCTQPVPCIQLISMQQATQAVDTLLAKSKTN